MPVSYKIISFSLLTLFLLRKEFASGQTPASVVPSLPKTESPPVSSSAKEDCDTNKKPEVIKELDPKGIEQKAAEQKALENLGLVPVKPIPKPAPVEVVPPAQGKMETCK